MTTNTGTITQTQTLTLGNETFTNAAGATYNFANDTGIAAASGTTPTFVNAGLLAKTGGSGICHVTVNTVDTGTISVAGGNIRFEGAQNSFSGTYIGPGMVDYGPGSAATLGTIAMTSGACTTNFGAVTQNGTVTVGNGSTIVTIAGASWTLAGAASVLLAAGSTSPYMIIKGTLTKTGTGASVIGIDFTNVGTVSVTGGSLSFTGASNYLSGTIQGSGLMRLGGGTTVINSGTTLAVAQVAISGSGTTATMEAPLAYAGTFTQAAGTVLTLVGGDFSLTGSASFTGATVNGTCRLLAQGPTTLAGLTIGGTAIFQNAKTAVQAGGAVQVGDGTGASATLLNAAGATYTITDDSGIAQGASAQSSILNQGLFRKAGGTGTSTLAASFVDTGTVAVATGTLALAGSSNSIAGAVCGAGTLLLAGGTTTFASGTALSVKALGLSGSGTIATIGTNLSYAGSFTQGTNTTLQLTGGYLVLNGSASFSAAVIAGSQRLYTRGTTTVAGLTIGGTAVVQNTATITQAGGTVTVGDTSGARAVLFNGAGATYAITDDSGIARGTSANSYILNQGTLQKTGGTGTSLIGLNVVNNASAAGTVAVASGTLDLGGALSGNLNLTIGAGATLILERSAAAGAAAAFTGANATLQLNAAQSYRGTIAGFAGGETLDLRSIGFGAGVTTTLGYTGNGSGGTLTVSDGTRTASLAMLGSYGAANFHLGADGAGGSAITFA